MKVFDLVCADGHRFEGWFASAEQFSQQCDASSVACPLCDSHDVRREPSAPRLNFGGEMPVAATSKSPPTDDRAATATVVAALRGLIAKTENVGPRFAEEARRIHYAEVAPRAIRGTATDRERRALEDEGIDTLTFALPAALTETLQ